MWFLAGVRMYVCVWARVCVAWDIDMKFGTPVKLTIFMTTDAWFVIFWDFEFFEKRTW